MARLLASQLRPLHSGALIGVLFWLGCAPAASPSGPGLEQLMAQPETFVLFENGTIDLVRVYLIAGGSQWLLGHADPGHVAMLRLPPGFTGRTGGGEQVSLVAVPLGAAWAGLPSRVGSIESIRSASEPVENLVHMRWHLAGRQLVSEPLRP